MPAISKRSAIAINMPDLSKVLIIAANQNLNLMVREVDESCGFEFRNSGLRAKIPSKKICFGRNHRRTGLIDCH